MLLQICDVGFAGLHFARMVSFNPYVTRNAIDGTPANQMVLEAVCESYCH
jgi:hypothetical protein